MREEWKSVTTTTGEHCAITIGITMMLQLCVDSWDSAQKVGYTYVALQRGGGVCVCMGVCVSCYDLFSFSSTGAIARGGGFFGEGFGRIHLDFLNCTGSEEQLMNCDSSGFGNAECFFFEADAGVICPGACV